MQHIAHGTNPDIGLQLEDRAVVQRIGAQDCPMSTAIGLTWGQSRWLFSAGAHRGASQQEVCLKDGKSQ